MSEEAADTNGGGVRFTAKEMFAKIDGTLARIENKLDGKADVSAVERLTGRVEALETARVELAAADKALSQDAKNALAQRQWRWPVVISSINVVLFAVAMFQGIHGL